MMGSTIVHRLQAKGYANILARARGEQDLLDLRAGHNFSADEVFLMESNVDEGISNVSRDYS